MQDTAGRPKVVLWRAAVRYLVHPTLHDYRHTEVCVWVLLLGVLGSKTSDQFDKRILIIISSLLSCHHGFPYKLCMQKCQEWTLLYR